MKILVLFYSAYGHIYQMAKAVVDGAKSVAGIEVDLKQVPETLSEDLLKKIGAYEARKAFADVPVAEVGDLAEYDAIIFGAPTRYGMMAAQMKSYLDATGALWAKGALIGKIGSVFTSTGTQHGGQESTILSFHTVLLHHGMLIAGLPYSFAGQSTMTEITGGSPYGASTIAGGDGSRTPTQNELDGAFYQGAHVAKILNKMK
ncbi:MAG: NAD(P)H:quinone oxidoreductase [Candidatus Cloacimonetes bacterium]|nr:NAD(P)H:quinone oxidoreductase [Candidatus Cloacimonadota bacterium]MDD2683762.1 NAD(P)H:quinone oxidoreductase [Candidatus Cloacimonadota bacterium]MDD3096387.1 NAD(P)H:quinone oxidoreductase [Candidatus Cloacimonadota bacterium]MDD4666646.1 NAD(P)H:quinone oxidoreductase [Candidatus Cloacimonadota bacterium]HPF08613.1 NAD(P)H:quinone oxidoreductase [Candidatus Cloacimonadota bacterium]